MRKAAFSGRIAPQPAAAAGPMACAQDTPEPGPGRTILSPGFGSSMRARREMPAPVQRVRMSDLCEARRHCRAAFCQKGCL